MGVVTTVVAFFMLRRDMKRGKMEMLGTFDKEKKTRLLIQNY